MFFLVFVLFLDCFSNWHLSAKKCVKIGLKIAQIAYLAAPGGGFSKKYFSLAPIREHVQ